MELNKKYYKHYGQLFIIVILLFQIVACDGVKVCYDSDDFSSNSEYDSFIVGNSGRNCYYDQSKTCADSENGSGSVCNCLEVVKLDAIDIANNYLFRKSGDSIDHLKESDISCKSIDPLIGQNDILIFSMDDNKDVTESQKSNIFRSCLNHCINECDKGQSQTNDFWTRANLKTETSYVGISLKKDTCVTINVSGSIILSDVSKEEKAEYNKYYADDIDYNVIYYNNPISNFNIYVKENWFNGNNEVKVNISDISDISYLDFVKLDSSTIIDSTDINEKYKFTKPNYDNIECDYRKPEGNKNSVYCEFKHRTNNTSLSEDESSRLDNYYNKNYKTSIFSDGDYYFYANDIFNEITSINSDNNYGFEEETLKITGFNKCIKLYGSNKCYGYILTKDNVINNNDNKTSEFSFKLTEASKIAIKYIGNEIPSECNYSIVEEYNSTNKNYIDSYRNEYINLSLEKNKWLVANIQNGSEIIFDEFSTIASPLETTITIKTNNLEKCYSGIVIKIIPLKEFQIKQTGFMFFSVPSIFSSIHSEEKDVKYRIINPKATTFKDSDDSDSYVNQVSMKERFYEQTNGDYSLSSSLSDPQKKLVVSNNNYFVRSGQIIRFDYSNFFTFENDNIKLKRIEYNFGQENTTDNLDYNIGLNVFIKEKRPFFCYVKSKENINLEKFCSKENGEYKTIITSDNDNKQVCYISNINCNAPDTLIKDYYSLDYKNAECKSTNSSYASENNLNIYDFWDKVYTDYKYVKSVVGENDTEVCVSTTNGEYKTKVYKSVCLSKYEDLIGKIYKEAKKCRDSINNNEYEIYYNNSKSIKELIESLPNIGSKTVLEEQIKELESLFKTSEIKNIENDTYENICTYKSNLYYYKKPCKNEGECQREVTQCYDATNLVVSLKTTFSYLNKGNKNIDAIGLNKLQSFDNSSRKGLIKDFLFTNTTKKNDNYTDIDGYYNIYYNGLIYPFDNSFIRMLIINNLYNVSNSIDDFSQQMRDGNDNIDDSFFKIILNKKTVYKNGDRLAVFIGCASESSNYKGDSLIQDTEKILPIVSYKKDANNSYVFDNEKSLCKFDSSGRLITNRGGSIGIDLSTTLFKEYSENIDNHTLCSDKEDEVFFFKIIDIDNNSANNECNYKVDIRAINETENTIINYFKSFFNTVLSFIDGSYISILTKNCKKVKCEDSSKDTCYIYEENYSENNGNSCKAGDNNCYASCDDTKMKDSFNCESFSDGKGFAKNVYLNFINDPLFQFIAKMALALAITLYGFGYFLGLSNFTQSEIVTKLIRFCAIYFLISPAGLNFFDSFVVKFFKDGIDSILFLIASAFELDVTSELSVAVASANYSDKSVLFSTCFSNLELLFSAPVFNKMLGLAFSSWYGLIYLYLVLMTVINYIVGVFSAIVMYLTSQIYMSLVFCFFPLVLLFMFFEKTKKTFDNWLGQLIVFAGQQIFLVMTVSFFNILIYNYIKSVFSYRVCWLSIFNINIVGFPLGAISFWKIPSSSATRGTLNTVDENAPSFYSIMSFYIIGILMSKFITGAAELGSSIFGGMNIGGGAASKVNEALNKGAALLDNGMKSTGAAFYKGVANRLGGKGIEDYKNKHKEETENRRNFMNSINEKTDKK